MLPLWVNMVNIAASIKLDSKTYLEHQLPMPECFVDGVDLPDRPLTIADFLNFLR